jgi:hypothetical protein
VTESVHGRLAAPQQEVCCGTEACRPRHNHPWFHQKGTYWCCVPSDMATHLPPAARKRWGQALCLGCCHFTVPALEVQSHACLCNRQCMLGWQHLSRRFAAARMRAGPDTTTPAFARREPAGDVCGPSRRLTYHRPQGCVGGRHVSGLLPLAGTGHRVFGGMHVCMCNSQCILDWQHLSRRFAAARMRAGPDTTTPGETRRASASVMCHLTWRLTTTWPQGCVGGRHCVWLLLYASISSRRLSLMQVGLCIRQCMLD